MDKALYYQFRDRKVDPPFLQSFERDFKSRSRLCITLMVGRLTRSNSLIHWGGRVEQWRYGNFQ
ncbi:MAG: hypothetical protein AB2693_23175, partial [Candidatus Thiodiazotropha sp.]